MSPSRYPYLIAAVAAVSGLLFGFDTAVINGALIFLREELELTTRGTEVAATSLLVGCAIGAALAGALTDRFGRKKLLIVSALLALSPAAFAGGDDAAIAALLDRMEAAVLAADAERYLACIDQSEAEWAREQIHWAADLAGHTPEAYAMELTSTPVADRSAIQARACARASWLRRVATTIRVIVPPSLG